MPFTTIPENRCNPPRKWLWPRAPAVPNGLLQTLKPNKIGLAGIWRNTPSTGDWTAEMTGSAQRPAAQESLLGSRAFPGLGWGESLARSGRLPSGAMWGLWDRGVAEEKACDVHPWRLSPWRRCYTHARQAVTLSQTRTCMCSARPHPPSDLPTHKRESMRTHRAHTRPRLPPGPGAAAPLPAPSEGLRYLGPHSPAPRVCR